ncbi:MAG: hypothetical protein ACR2IK_10270 [Chloroflexota bacterium]
MATAELLSPQQLAARSNGVLSVATVRRHLAAGRGGPGVVRTPGGWFKAPAGVLDRLLTPVSPLPTGNDHQVGEAGG